MEPEQTEGNGDVKALTPVICPHCNETMVIEFTLTANLLDKEVAAEILSKLHPQANEEA